MKTVLHQADTRGHAAHGWLDSHHTFSFADYHDPERIHFGMLRVLNDDIVSGGMGFDIHPHNNMEIISIPLEGSLQHKDSTGSEGVIKRGEIQVMSAGTGVYHSEYNNQKDKPVKFLQIWVIPNLKSVRPRYQQALFNFQQKKNQLLQIVSPNEKEGLWIHQDAWFNMGIFDKDKGVTYRLKKATNGVYIFVIEGSFEINGQSLARRDGLGVWETNELSVISKADDAEILLIEVPME